MQKEESIDAACSNEEGCLIPAGLYTWVSIVGLTRRVARYGCGILAPAKPDPATLRGFCTLKNVLPSLK